MAQKAVKQLEESTTKRPKRAASANQQAIAAASAPDKWSVESEVLVLETFLRISENLGVKPSYEQIYEAVQGFIPDSFSSKERVGTKLRHLKRKFLRTHAAASPPLDDLVYQLSEKIWGEAAGTSEAEGADAKAEAEEADSEADAEENHAVASAQPKRKRKTKTTSAVSVPPVHQEDDMTIEKDTGAPIRSPRAQTGAPVPRPQKALAKSKDLGLIATGKPSTAVELDDSYMLPGLVRIVQQSYSDADEKLVRTALENMDPPHVEGIRKDWHKLQLLKLEVASRTSNMAAELLGVLHRRAAAGGVSDG